MARRRNYPFNSRDLKWGTNLVSSIITGLIVAPIAIANSLPDTPASNTTTNTSNTSIKSSYKKIINNIVKQVSNDKCISIRKEYYKLIKNNKRIQNLIKKMKLKKEFYKHILKATFLFPKFKCNYTRKIDNIIKEITTLENKYTTPTIILETSENSTTSIKLRNAYISLNNKISECKKIYLEYTCQKCIEKDSGYFKVNTRPQLLLQFNDIELYFYNDFIILMTNDNFVVIDYESISVEKFKNSVIMDSPSSNSQFKVLWQRWEHSRMNGGPDLRYKYNALHTCVEINIIKLMIFSETINLIFANTTDADFIYRLITDKQFRLISKIMSFSSHP